MSRPDEKKSTTTTCPTCGSDDPRVHQGRIEHEQLLDPVFPDDFHFPAPSGPREVEGGQSGLDSRPDLASPDTPDQDSRIVGTASPPAPAGRVETSDGVDPRVPTEQVAPAAPRGESSEDSHPEVEGDKQVVEAASPDALSKGLREAQRQAREWARRDVDRIRELQAEAAQARVELERVKQDRLQYQRAESAETALAELVELIEKGDYEAALRLGKARAGG